MKLMNQAVTFFKDTLLVLPNPSSSLVINTTSCGDYNLPDYLRTQGVNNSDLHILVTFFDDSDGDRQNTVA
jgi:hypothetical protein